MTQDNACPEDVAQAVYTALESGAKLPLLQDSKELRKALLAFRTEHRLRTDEQINSINGNFGPTTSEDHAQAQCISDRPKSPKTTQDAGEAEETSGGERFQASCGLMWEALLRRRMDAVQQLYEVCPQLLASIPLFDQQEDVSHQPRSSESQNSRAIPQASSVPSGSTAALFKSGSCPFQRSSQLLDLAAENQALLVFVLQHHPDVDVQQSQLEGHDASVNSKDARTNSTDAATNGNDASMNGYDVEANGYNSQEHENDQTSGSENRDSSVRREEYSAVTSKSNDKTLTDGHDTDCDRTSHRIPEREKNLPLPQCSGKEGGKEEIIEENIALVGLDPTNPVTICIQKKNPEVLQYLLFKHVWQHFLLDDVYRESQSGDSTDVGCEVSPSTCRQCEWFLLCAAVMGSPYLLDLVLCGKFCDHTHQRPRGKPQSLHDVEDRDTSGVPSTSKEEARNGMAEVEQGDEFLQRKEGTSFADENESLGSTKSNTQQDLLLETVPCLTANAAQTRVIVLNGRNAELTENSVTERSKDASCMYPNDQIIFDRDVESVEIAEHGNRVSELDAQHTDPNFPPTAISSVSEDVHSGSVSEDVHGRSHVNSDEIHQGVTSSVVVPSQEQSRIRPETKDPTSLGTPPSVSFSMSAPSSEPKSESLPLQRSANEKEKDVQNSVHCNDTVCEQNLTQLVQSNQMSDSSHTSNPTTPKQDTQSLTAQTSSKSCGREGLQYFVSNGCLSDMIRKSHSQEPVEQNSASLGKSQPCADTGQKLAASYGLPDPNTKQALSLPIMDRWISRCMHVRLCPLHLACWRCDPASVSVLLGHGADVNIAAEELESQKDGKDGEDKMDSSGSSQVPSTPTSAASLDTPFNFVSLTLNSHSSDFPPGGNNSLEKVLKKASLPGKGGGLTPLAILALGIRSPPDFSLSMGKSLGLVLPTLPEVWGGQVDRTSQQAKQCLMETLHLLLNAGSDVNASSVVFGKTYRVMELFLQPSVDLYYAPLMPRGGRDSAVLRCMDLERVAEIVLSSCWELLSRGGRMGPEISLSMEWNLFRMDWMFMKNDDLQGRFLHLAIFLGLFPLLDPALLLTNNVLLQHGTACASGSSELDCEVCQSRGNVDLKKVYFSNPCPPSRPSCVPWAHPTSRTSSVTHSDASASGSGSAEELPPLLEDHQQSESADVVASYCSTVGTQVTMNQTQPSVLQVDQGNASQTPSQVSDSCSSVSSHGQYKRLSATSSKTRILRGKLQSLGSDIAALNSSQSDEVRPAAVTRAQKMLWALEERQRRCLEKLVSDVVRLGVPQSSLALILRFLCLPDIHLLSCITQYTMRTSTSSTESTLQRLADSLAQAQFRSLRHSCKLVILMSLDWRYSAVLTLPLPNGLKNYLLDSFC